MNHSAEYFHNLKAKLIKDYDDGAAKRNGVVCDDCTSIFASCSLHTASTKDPEAIMSWLLRVVRFVEKYGGIDDCCGNPIVTPTKHSTYKLFLEETRDACTRYRKKNFSKILCSTRINKSTRHKADNHRVVKDMVNDLIHLTADLMVNYKEDNWFDTYSAEHPEVPTKDINDFDHTCERAKVNKTLSMVFDKLRLQRDDDCSQNRVHDKVRVVCHDGFIMEGKTSAVREYASIYPSMFTVDSECDLFYRLKPKCLDDCFGISRPEYITVFAAYFYAISIVVNEMIVDEDYRLDLNRSHISHEVFQLRSKSKFNIGNFLFSILHRYHYDKNISFIVMGYSLPIEYSDTNFSEIKVPWPIKDYRNFEQHFYKTREQLRLAYGNFYFQYDLLLEKLCNPKVCVCSSCCKKEYTSWFFIKGGEKTLFKGISAADKRWLFTTFAFTDPKCNTIACTIPKPPVRRSASI